LRESLKEKAGFKGKALDRNLSALEEGLKYPAGFRRSGIEKVEKDNMEI